MLGRALFKIALGIIALSQGREQACSDRYSPARKFIRGEKGDFKNNFFIKHEGKPHAGGRISYQDFEEGTIVAIDIMGIIFLINLEEKPFLAFNGMIKPENYTLYHLYDE